MLRTHPSRCRTSSGLRIVGNFCGFLQVGMASSMVQLFLRLAEFGAVEMCAFEMRASEEGAFKMCLDEVGAVELRQAEEGVFEMRLGEDSAFEMRPEEVG